MPQAKQITIVEILEDHLGDTYPRVLAKVVNDEGKESKLTIFKNKKGIVPELNHTYMGYLKKPKEGFTIWSFNIAYPIKTDEPIDDEPFPDELNASVDDSAITPPETEHPDPPDPVYVDTPLYIEALKIAATYYSTATQNVKEDDLFTLADRIYTKLKGE